MTEEIVTVGLVVSVVILVWILFLTIKDKKDNAYMELAAIIHSPTKKGHLGEAIVREALSFLPKGSVTEQFMHPDMPGRPDFAILIDDKYLIIDSKFSTKEETRYLVKRGIGMTKYIVPKLTHPMVLMWIPEPAWEEMSITDYNKLIAAKIIPCTTAGLVSTVHLFNYLYGVLDIRDIDDTVVLDKITTMKAENEGVITVLEKAQTQLHNATNNLMDARTKLYTNRKS